MKLNDYFQGKICTVFTKTINRNFDEQQAINYFVGLVDYIDDSGIMMTHTITGCKNFYFLHNVCAISEEQVLDASDPENAKLIEQYKKKQTKSASPYIDLENLEELSRLSKAK